MSYILDALKKSEQERNRGNIPTLHTTSQVVLSHRYLWIGILIGVGALSGLAALAWVANLKLFQPASMPAQRSVTEAETEAQMEIQTDIHGEAQATGSRAMTDTVDEKESTGQATGQAEPAPAAISFQEARKVDSVSDLGSSARAKVEGLSVNVVSYSEIPERRFVMLNQRIVREGESVGQGLMVKEILPNGALISVDGHEIVIRPE